MQSHKLQIPTNTEPLNKVLKKVLKINLTGAQIGQSMGIENSDWLYSLLQFDYKSTLEFGNLNLSEFVCKDDCSTNFSLDDKDIDRTKFNLDSEKLDYKSEITFVNFVAFPTELVLAGIKIGDALRMNSQTEFGSLNLENSQIPYFIINIPFQKHEEIKTQETLSLIEGKHQSDWDLNRITKVEIKFEDAHINNFQINYIPSKDKFYFFPNLKNNSQIEQNNGRCNFTLDGFVFEDLNYVAFNLLNFCLNKEYHHFKSPQNSEERKNLNRLLQPLDQLAIISRNLGRYRVENELLYRRKYLELLIARQQGLTLERIELEVSNFFYGFGHKRNRVVYIILILLIFGTNLTYVVLKRKQKSILKQTIELQENEVNFDPIIDKKSYKTKDFAKVKYHLDFFDQIIFNGSFDSHEEKKIYLRFKFKPELDVEEKKLILDNSPNQKIDEVEFVKIKLKNIDQEEKLKNIIKYILEKVDERSNNGKVGICENLLPDSGFHLVCSKQKNREEFHIYNLILGDEKGEDFSYKGLDVKYRLFLLLSPLLTFCIISILLSVEILAFLTILIVIIFVIIMILAELLLPSFHSLIQKNRRFSRIIIYKKIKTKFWNLKRKTLLKSLIYSVDSIIPIIEFDQELNDFISKDSPDWFEIYFIVHKILGIVSLAIVLPILLILG